MLNEKKRIAGELSDLQNQRDALRTKVELLRRKKQDLDFQKSKVEDLVNERMLSKQEIFRRFQELDE